MKGDNEPEKLFYSTQTTIWSTYESTTNMLKKIKHVPV